MAKTKFTPVRVPVRRKDGTVGSGIRFKNLIPAPTAKTPPAGPATRSEPVVSFDEYGFDNSLHRNGTRFDDAGFDVDGVHQETGTEYGPDGFDADGLSLDDLPREDYVDGWDKAGFNPWGRDSHGFNRYGFHDETEEERDEEGFDFAGLSRDDLPREDYFDGWDKAGFNPWGRDSHGFNRYGLHDDTNEEYDEDGFDFEGFSLDGTSRVTTSAGWTPKDDGYVMPEALKAKLRASPAALRALQRR